MEKKVINLFIIIYFTIVSVANGQLYSTDLPYILDIKNNIKNLKVANLSSIGKELSYIPLETSPQCLIQQIDKILFSDSYIFINDGRKRLLQFDKNGKFIKQIGSQGRGPKEYYYMMDFCLDETSKEIFIISDRNKLSVFDFDGIFKNSYKLTFRPSQIVKKDQNSLMYHLANVPGKNDPSWIITNKQGVLSTIILNNIKRLNQPGFIVLYTPLFLFNKTVHFMEFGIDTLYYFKDTQRKPYAVFFLGDFKMDTDPLISPSSIKDEKLLNKFWVESILETSEFLFIKFNRGITNGKICGVYNKKTNTVTFLKDDAFRNDLDGGVLFWPKQIMNDNILIDYIDAFDLLKPQPGTLIKKESARLSTLKKKLTETSNPVLIILK